MEIIKKIALILVIIGAINWLMVGLFELDLVATIFGGSTNILAKIVYVLVGISGLISISFYLMTKIKDHMTLYFSVIRTLTF